MKTVYTIEPVEFGPEGNPEVFCVMCGPSVVKDETGEILFGSTEEAQTWIDKNTLTLRHVCGEGCSDPW